jgi:Tfp pilus assembly protein PilF
MKQRYYVAAMKILNIQKGIIMRMTIRLIGIAIVLILIFSSCGKEIVPAKVAGKTLKNYDEAQFNYIYVEAVKEKLIGNPGEALKYFEQAIKINPSCDACYYQIAQIVVANNDNVNGKKYLRTALSIDANNIWYLLMLSGIYYQEQNLDSAIIYYERIIKTEPDKVNNLLTLGNLYSEDKRYEEAKAVYDSFEEKYGVNETTTVSAIKNLLLAEKYNEAEIKAKELLLTAPDNILYNGLLAEIYKGKRESQKALEVYKGLIDRNPGNGPVQLSLCDFLISEKSYDELFELLTTIFLNGSIAKEDKIAFAARLIDDKQLASDYEQKLVLSLMVLEASYKEDNVVPILRPELYIKIGKLDVAAQRLEEIIKQNDSNYYAWEKLLLTYLQMEDFKKLMTRGEVCATQFNRSFIAKVLYANGAIEMGKYDIALSELKKAEILAGNDDEMKLQVITMRADVYYRMKDFNNAFSQFDEALKINSNDLTVLNNYAYFLAEQNLRLKEADEMITKVVSTEKDNTTFLDTYAWVLYKRGKLKDAAKVMVEILGSGQKPDAEWYEHYGYILKKQKKCDEAVLNWNIAVKLDPAKTHLVKEIEACTK